MAKKKKGKKKSTPARKKKQTVSFWKNKNNLFVLAGIFLITIITLYPSLNNKFVNWDDDKNFYENQLVVNSNNISNLISNTPAIFKETVIGNYNPLSNFSFAVESAIFGLDRPFNWHLDNLLLHLICVMLIFRIALALGLNLWAAAICGILFGIHPMRIESVAWVTERKDVLFGSFYLMALYYYIKAIKINKPNKFRILIIVMFILSGLSKIQAVSLPLSMLAVDYYLGRKVGFKIVLEKWFYFLISLAIGILGIVFLSDQGSLDAQVDYSLIQRLFVGSYSYMVYIIKFFVPYQLVPMYPYPPTLGPIFYISMIPALGVVGLLIFSYLRQWKALTFGILFFTFNIVFLLQIVGAGQGFIADRFTYIAYFGFFFAAAYYLQKLHANLKWRNIVNGVVIAYLLAFAYISFNQCKIWKDSGTLWTHVIKYYPNTTLPWGNRANFYRDEGLTQKALSDYSMAISMGARKANPYNSRAKLFFRSPSRDTVVMALNDYNTAISLDPSKSEYYMNRGATYARLGDKAKALADLTQALEIDRSQGLPENPTIYLNRSIVYHELRQYQNEINDINKYLSYNRNNGNMWANRGNAYMFMGQWEQGLSDINQAIKLNPRAGVYYYYRAQYYYNTGQIAQAQQDVTKANQLGFAFRGPLENLRM